MIALGIDPGSTRIGYGIVHHEGNRLIMLGYGTIENTNKDRCLDLQDTETELIKIIKKYKPDQAGIEKLFFTKNQKTAMAVSETRGVLLLTLSKNGLPIQEFTPNEVKQKITAYGHADKNQVYRMVQLLLNTKKPIKPDDAVDALAIAICCSHNIIRYK
ncbi:MAG: crossover junction endodeoxyribonuclease RuvC [Candidatus Yanofskybacteria bacterium RIFCSPLOWO2_02_FULL_47_9b]|uniref:Crossover junction endodeoxyribonuclease RuvC n=1 Tax=Candidatus Yanofskybacteria bacterium RIFCSPLOWO2_02_FULL_47_9b TaxID=1802708 RepID=A0A1F8HA83_9BACT|nr:MAG: crossover junction endodeoxyribonuclease RuvC [Candidatus Yanofskybacteria bacterium RIFCSPLOWO2_02_FULL_47_9b]